MQLSSILFLYTFLPVALALFWITPGRWKMGVLCVFNLVFWLFTGLYRFPLLLLCPLFDFFVCRRMERIPRQGKRRPWALAGTALYVALTALLLVSSWCGSKQLPLFFPLGFTCWALRSVSYLWDVARKEITAEKNFLRYFTYQTLFCFRAGGPVVSYQDLGGSFSPCCSRRSLAKGLQKTIRGIAKMTLLGQSLISFWNGCLEAGTVLSMWLGLAALAMGLYYMFSGLSDLSIGVGAMFGLSLPENFDHPLAAASIGGFLGGWQKTLSRCFYRYFPQGHTTPTRFAWFFPMWALIGLLQGGSWNLAVWGLYVGFLLVVEQVLQAPLFRLKKGLGWLITFLLLLPGWVLFALQPDQWGSAFGAMFGQNGFCNAQTGYLLLHNSLFLLAGAAFAGPWVGRWRQKKERGGPMWWTLLSVGYAVLLALSTAWLIGGGPVSLTLL